LSSIHRLIELGLELLAKLLGHDFLIRLQNKLLPILKFIAKLDHNSKGFTIKTSMKVSALLHHEKQRIINMAVTLDYTMDVLFMPLD